jgi:hypothetical protein
VVCNQKSRGGLCILDLEKFKRALRLRWLWYERIDPGHDWVGLGNPCSDDEMRLLYASMNFTIGNVKTTVFWHSHRLGMISLNILLPPFSTFLRRISW